MSLASRLRPLAVLLPLCVPAASAPPLAAVLPVPAPAAALAGLRAQAPGPCRGRGADFDGDGAADAAAGAPYAAVGGQARAGRVAVRYGARAGTPLVQAGDPPEAGDGFGAALAIGDFDRDRCADLAVGVPDEVSGARRPGAEGHGAVQIFHGSPAGLRPGRRLSVRDLRRPYGTDRFGAALAAADLDGDRDDELVVGAPGLAGGGGVAVFGLDGTGLRPGPLVTQRSGWAGQEGREGREAAPTDGFGTVLAAADLDGDGRAEIAAGAPGDGLKSEGAVTVLDPRARTARRVAQDEPGIGGVPERLDHFGAALAAGDFDRDGRAELAIGIPGEDDDPGAATGDAQGAVQVVDGRTLRQRGPTLYGRGAKGPYDRFGAALAAGDLTGDGTDDLAAGAPGHGYVRILRGARGGGPGRRGGVTITSPHGPEAQFGWSLAVRRGALLVGAPGAAGFGGAVTAVAGSGPRGTAVPLEAGGLLGYALGQAGWRANRAR
ncbi:FG-GAP repeat protein [Spirillospora sp. NPDC029432]|uniref:FG-GAP repeat protein n=1 Tax=Spirillospora sp. NPDC029432 TaxID=3154599 RepID=UPI0034556D3F